MARINFEDDLDQHDEYKKLIELIGKEEMARGHEFDLTRFQEIADGRLKRFWKMAQYYWGMYNMALVPKEKFYSDEKFCVILESGMAEDRDGGIFARGSETQFDWYLQKCNASKSAKKKRDKKTKSRTPNEDRTDTERTPSGDPLTLTPSLTLTQSSIDISSSLDLRGEKSPPPSQAQLISIEKKLRRDATRAKDVVIAVYRECAGDDEECEFKAKEGLGPLYEILLKRWPSWGSFCSALQHANENIKIGLDKFEFKLVQHFETYLPDLWRNGQGA